VARPTIPTALVRCVVSADPLTQRRVIDHGTVHSAACR